MGLRWWNEVYEQGGSMWEFECLDRGVYSKAKYISFLTRNFIYNIFKINFYIMRKISPNISINILSYNGEKNDERYGFVKTIHNA